MKRKLGACLLAASVAVAGSGVFADQAVISRYVSTTIATFSSLVVSGAATLGSLAVSGLSALTTLTVSSTSVFTGTGTFNGALIANSTADFNGATTLDGATTTSSTFTAGGANGVTAQRIDGIGTAPTCSSTGLGTGSAAIATGSTDLSGVCTLSPTGVPSANGLITLTFTTGNGAYGGGSGPVCVLGIANGTASWLGTSIVVQSTFSTTAPTFVWATNSSILTAGSTYHVTYICTGR